MWFTRVLQIVNPRKNNLKEKVFHDFTTFIAFVTGLVAHAMAAGFSALAPTLGTITPVIGADGFATVPTAARSVAGYVVVAALFSR